MKNYKKSILAAALMTAIGLTGCSDGEDGQDGQDGAPGQDGDPGTSIGNVVDTVDAATDFVLTVAPEDIVVVGSEDFAVKFTATGKNAKGEVLPFTGLDQVALYVMNQAENTTDTGAPILWESNGLANDASYSMYCTLTGTANSWGTEVDACTLVEDEANPGTYTGTWEHDGNAPVVLENGDANGLHRVMVRTYNVVDSSGTAISDKLLSTPIDFIPATGEIAISLKDSVSNEACIKCHGQLDGYDDADTRIASISAHHNYQKVENCVACHNPAYAGGEDDPTVGWNANWNAMIHTLHAGHHLDLEGEAKEMFSGVGFPAELSDCTTCHDSGTQWNDNVYAEACVSCHTNVDFETGEGHSEFNLAQADDSACSSCHGTGSLSPVEAHNVMSRGTFTEGLVLEVVSADVAAETLTVILDVQLNGAVAADGTDLTQYLNKAASGDDILIGTLDDNGDYIRGLSVNTANNPEQFVVADGKLTITTAITDGQLDGKTISVSSEMNMCGDQATSMIIENTKLTEGAGTDSGACDIAIPANIVTKFFEFGDSADAGVLTEENLRFVSSELADYMNPTQASNDRTTVDEVKCNACHGNMSHIKSPNHGVTDFTQCADCHNNSYAGSYHADVYTQSGVDEDGEPTFELMEGLEYYNRDLATVAHRFHSGMFAGSTGGGIYLAEDGETWVNYPAAKTNCQACHKDADSNGDAMTFFDGNGELTSGREAIAETDNYGQTVEFISPVAEACRSCHAHSGAAALAHFKSNGATVFGDEVRDASLVPVESCSTCHAEGKTYGVDVMHSGTSH